MKLKYFLLIILLPLLCACSNRDKYNDPSNIFNILTFVAGIIILLLILVAAFRPLRVRKNSKFEPKNSARFRENTYKQVAETSPFDDFYPTPRKFKVDLSAIDEDNFHTKLNYHNIIEKLTRKLYLLFLSIIGLTIAFAFTLYKTSVSERIAPSDLVMEQYGDMMQDILVVEDSLETKQIAKVDQIKRFSLIKTDSSETEFQLNSKLTDSIKTSILMKTVDYEDKIIAQVNSDFFNVYYWRYILVRFLVSFLILSLIRYLMRLYMRIRADRNDLIRKEEALSILFYVLEDLRKAETNEGKSLYGDILRDKIPKFPLRTLFESPEGRKGKNDVSSQMESVLEDLLGAQTRSTQAIEKLAESISSIK